MSRHHWTTCLILGGSLLALATVALASNGLYGNDPPAAQAETDSENELRILPPPGRSAAPNATTPPASPPAATPAQATAALGQRLEHMLETQTEPTLRDPTQPGEELEGLVAPIRMGQNDGAGGLGLPRISLKGRIIGPIQAPAAMIQVEEALFVVEQGSQITVPTPNIGLGSVTLKITELSAQQVQIEIMPLRQAIVLR